MSDAKKTDEDDIWGEAPASLGDSAFSSAPPVVDAEFTDQSGYGHEDGYEGESAPEADQPKSKPKPNIALLAVAGVLGLAILGGGGFFAYNKFMKPKHNASQMAQAPMDRPDRPGRANRPGKGEENGQFLAGATAAAGVFDAAPANGGPAGMFDAPGQAASAPAVDMTPAPATPSAPVAAAAVPPPPPPATAMAGIGSDMALSPNQNRCVSACVQEKPKKQKKVKSYVATETAKADKSKKVRSAKVTKRNTKVKSVKKAPTEEILSSPSMTSMADVRVVGVYPLSGINSQAWLRSPTGEIVIVRKGDCINGIIILDVIPEQNLVKTSAGNVTTLGVNL